MVLTFWRLWWRAACELGVKWRLVVVNQLDYKLIEIIIVFWVKCLLSGRLATGTLSCSLLRSCHRLNFLINCGESRETWVVSRDDWQVLNNRRLIDRSLMTVNYGPPDRRKGTSFIAVYELWGLGVPSGKKEKEIGEGSKNFSFFRIKILDLFLFLP